MDVKLPKLGEGADSGVVVNLFVKEGDTVANGQAIIELENEKAVASVPSTGAGVVSKIFVKPGDRISVGQRILSVEGGRAPAAAPAAAPGGGAGGALPAGGAHGVTRPVQEVRPAPAVESPDENEIITENPRGFTIGAQNRARVGH